MKPILSAAVLFLCSAATLLPQDTGSARDLLPAPELKAKPGPSELDLHGDSHTLYEQVAHAFGLECVFDQDFPAGPGIHFHVMGDDYREALHALEAATGSFVVAVTDHVFLVARDTPQNRAEHEPTVKMVVHLSQAENAQQMTEVVRAVQQAIGVEKASWNAQSGTVEFIGPLSKVIPARQIFEDLRRPRPQVLVELQMIEVSRNDMLSWGLTLPNTIRIKPPDSPTDVVTTLAQVARWWSGGAGLGVTIANAALVAQMSQAINKSLLHMEMRSMDNQAATFHVGDKYPILTASYIGQTGAPGIGSQLPVNNPSNSNGTGSATQTGKVFGAVSQPAGMITADLNGDGVPDIVTAAAGANAVAVLFGNGDGTFQDAVTYPAGTTPSGVAVADLNSDGVPDLIAANAGSNDISVLLGNSDGTFQPALQYPVGSKPAAILAGDFDGDGYPDIAVANSDSNNVTVLLGKGDGAFKSTVTTAVGTSPRSLVAADFNNDGNLDLATANFTSNDVSILLSNGNGAFRVAGTYAAGSAPRAITAPLINLDSQIDLVVANSGSNSVSVFLGDGAGGFSDGTQFPTGPDPVAVTTGDFNSDTLKDIAVANPDNGTVSLLLSLGNGTFQAPISVSTGAAATSIVSGDFNRDGLPDLLTANQPSGDFSILLGYGNAGFHDPGGNGYNSSGGTTFAPPPSFTFEDLGLSVKVTPHVHGMEEVGLDVDAEFKLLTGQASNGMPVISNRKLTSHITARNGEWGVIAGLLSTSDARSVAGLPGLSSVKGLGSVLRTNTRNRDTNQILLLIKTHLLDPPPDENLTQTVRTGSETRPLTRM